MAAPKPGAWLPVAAAVKSAILLLAVLPSAGAFDALDPFGSITVKWDVMQWTRIGYVATVTMYNLQQYRHIQAPGWVLGWEWVADDVIWSMVGAQATLQGDCSRFKDSAIPHSCRPDPHIVDLLPGVPYGLQTGNCCRGGVLASYLQDPANAVASFGLVVGTVGNTNATIQLPKNFTLAGPGPGYTCGPAVVGSPTLFPTPDNRRFTQAQMTWNVTCLYSQRLAHRAPTCCVSFSAFYNSIIVPCATCSCACQSDITSPEEQATCVDPTDQNAITSAQRAGPTLSPANLYCSNDMCPVKIHWHVKANYVQYWRVKITITNRNLFQNYSQWNIVAQHPNFDNFTQAYSFSYRSFSPYGDTNDTAVFFGIKYFNDMLMSAGLDGNVQSEILFRKDSSFTFKEGWAFPRRIYFNGDDCVLPDSDDFPRLPNAAPGMKASVTLLMLLCTLITLITSWVLLP